MVHEFLNEFKCYTSHHQSHEKLYKCENDAGLASEVICLIWTALHPTENITFSLPKNITSQKADSEFIVRGINDQQNDTGIANFSCYS